MCVCVCVVCCVGAVFCVCVVCVLDAFACWCSELCVYVSVSVNVVLDVSECVVFDVQCLMQSVRVFTFKWS